MSKAEPQVLMRSRPLVAGTMRNHTSPEVPEAPQVASPSLVAPPMQPLILVPAV